MKTGQNVTVLEMQGCFATHWCRFSRSYSGKYLNLQLLEIIMIAIEGFSIYRYQETEFKIPGAKQLGLKKSCE